MGFPYKAFISYSWENTDQAQWLRKRLASTGRFKNELNEETIFLDTAKMSAGADLDRKIVTALTESEFLILLCTPESAKSFYVDLEIRKFKEIHGKNKIVACIFSGNSKWIKYTQDQNHCFPHALRFKIDDETELENQPDYADFRKENWEEAGSALVSVVSTLCGLKPDEVAQSADDAWNFFGGYENWPFAASQPDSVLSGPFLRKYREKLTTLFDRWDLRHVGAAAAGPVQGKVVDATLEQMYVPLRLGEGYNPGKLKEGKTLKPEEVLSLSKPLVVRGVAGSGKTTWMRWTFRQLLQRADTFPVFVELRALARYWQNAEKKSHNLESFLGSWLEEYGLKEWQGAFFLQFSRTKTVTPVLLVDGWDELGELGQDFRQKLLVFMKEHPGIRVVLSSRPYGDGRPTHSDGFTVWDVQPLDDGEIRQLSRNFFQHIHGSDPVAGEKAIEDFMDRLLHTPEAHDLARTALLLTMMLLVSRTSPLPDRRHKLYQVTLDNLLSALPDRREQEGVRGERHRWRPDSGAERLRVAAALAHGMQETGYGIRTGRKSLVQSWEEMAKYLPSDWDSAHKDGFLSWLSGPAGVLVDRTDDKLSFAHLSFQEFLTAWHLYATIEGDPGRIALVTQWKHLEFWWETLRLWAALVADTNPERLKPAFSNLCEDEEYGLWLAGTFLADGSLEKEFIEKWSKWSGIALAKEWKRGTDQGLNAWKVSRKEDRKAIIQSHWQNVWATSTNWVACQRLQEGLEVIGLQPMRDHNLPGFKLLLHALNDAPEEDKGLAVGRLLNGGASYWPDWSESLLMQTWPGRRRQWGFSGQNLLFVLGFESVLSLGKTSSSLLFPEAESRKSCDLARYLARDLARDRARDWARYLARDKARYLAHDRVRDLARDTERYLARDWARYLAHYLVRDRARYLARDLTYHLSRYLPRYLSRDWVRYWARDLVRDWVSYLAHDLSRYLAHEIKMDPKQNSHLDLLTTEVLSPGRAGTRALLAYGRFGPYFYKNEHLGSEMELFRHACRLSFHQGGDDGAFRQAMAHYETLHRPEPLWSALARHVARRSTPEDRALLEDLARHPEKREGRLQWCLRAYIRGDLVTPEGEWMLLDDLLKRLDIEPPPYLEEMPDELNFPSALNKNH
ncbi:MAG: TIR domain-containing protein [Nitrospirae bacterium]|nr:TIR domain-containing protein [Magnetococcales bacterium]